MSFPLGIPIVCTAVVTTLTGAAPEDVLLMVTDPNNVTRSIGLTVLPTHPVGSVVYRGFFVPNIVGTWHRTWSGSNLMTTDSTTLQVV